MSVSSDLKKGVLFNGPWLPGLEINPGLRQKGLRSSTENPAWKHPQGLSCQDLNSGLWYTEFLLCKTRSPLADPPTWVRSPGHAQ